MEGQIDDPRENPDRWPDPSGVVGPDECEIESLGKMTCPFVETVVAAFFVKFIARSNWVSRS
jgi:hypothetical protein